MSAPGKLFAVARVGWRVSPDSGWYTTIMPDLRDTSGPEDRRFVPVAAFPDRATAEARARELELEAARLFNPFWQADAVRDLSSAAEPEVRRRLEALVGPPPPEPVETAGDRWQAWWDEHAPDWPDGTLWAVWELFDRVRFYAVLEVEAGDE